MTDTNQDDPAIQKPSQAEGDRETIEEALGERSTTSADQQHPDPAVKKPSQAEGERDSSAE